MSDSSPETTPTLDEQNKAKAEALAKKLSELEIFGKNINIKLPKWFYGLMTTLNSYESHQLKINLATGNFNPNVINKNENKFNFSIRNGNDIFHLDGLDLFPKLSPEKEAQTRKRLEEKGYSEDAQELRIAYDKIYTISSPLIKLFDKNTGGQISYEDDSTYISLFANKNLINLTAFNTYSEEYKSDNKTIKESFSVKYGFSSTFNFDSNNTEYSAGVSTSWKINKFGFGVNVDAAYNIDRDLIASAEAYASYNLTKDIKSEFRVIHRDTPFDHTDSKSHTTAEARIKVSDFLYIYAQQNLAFKGKTTFGIGSEIAKW